MAAPKDEKTKEFHIFISYRVSSDAILAEKICDKVQQHMVGSDARCRFTCFLDKQSLRKGEAWKDQFLAAVGNSCLFLPLLSPAALSPFLEENFNEDVPDNLLLEFEKAVVLMEEKQLCIFPLLVGSHDGGLYQRFDSFGGYSQKKHLGHASPAETLAKLFSIQGTFLNAEEISEKIPIIVAHFEDRVWVRFRHMWFNREHLGPETQHECVQCGQLYLESQNEDSACFYHKQPKWGKYPCCNTTNRGCIRARHRATHHNDFEYEKHYAFVNSILGYTNTHESKLSVTAENFDGRDINVDIGLVQGASKYKGNVYVSCSNFYLFDKKESEFWRHKVASGDDNTLYKLKKKDGCTLSVSWFFPQQEEPENPVYGLRAVCCSPSSEKDCIGEMTFTWKDDELTCLSSKMLQNGNFREKKLRAPHDVSRSAHYFGDLLKEVEPLPHDAKPEDVYHTEDDHVSVKTNGRLTANKCRPPADKDVIFWPITVVNYTNNPVLVTDAKGQWSHFGKDMQDVDVEIIDETQYNNGQPQSALPVRLDPLTPQNLLAKLTITTKEKEAVSFAWFDCAWIAASSPLLLSLSLSLRPNASPSPPKVITTFTNPHAKLYHTKDKAGLFWLVLDDHPSFKREHLYVKLLDSWKDVKSGLKVSMGNKSIDLDKKAMRGLCVQARKENSDTISLGELGEGVKGTALIDRNAGIVYAFHFEAENQYMKVQGVYPVPEYYDIEEDVETVDPCKPHELALPNCPTGWEVFPEDSVPFAEPPPLNKEKYIPSSSPSPSAAAAASSSPPSVDLGEVLGLLGEMNDKMDLALGKLGVLEAKVEVLTLKVNSIKK